MEDGDGYLFSEDSLGNKCDKSSQQVYPSLKAKYENPKFPKESTKDEDCYKLSCYNNVTKNAKESNDLKAKLNGDVGSGIDADKCDMDVIHEDKSEGERTCSDNNVVDRVNDEHGSLNVVGRKRKMCEIIDVSSSQHGSAASEIVQNTSLKKVKLSRVSIPTQSVIPQAETSISKQISEDSTTLQNSSSSSSESQSSDVSHQAAGTDPAEPDTHLTGFAQYLGLQPIVKFRCFKCAETGFPSLLKLQEHQSTCLKNLKVPLLPKPSQSHNCVDPSLSSTNFRISRKVFLCGSCGTYYENWNLFLHMREVHKRLICLYCLTMFSQVDMLSTHLAAKHGIVETVYSSPEDLLKDCKESCFLMCCDCDTIFTERDDFANHACAEKLPVNIACHLCGLRGTHFSSCPRAVTSSNNTNTSASCSFSQTDAGSSITDSKHSPQITSCERGGAAASVTKYLIPVSSIPVPSKKIIGKKLHVLEDSQEHSNELSDVDDDYDISNAASFCHVNIHEPIEKLTSAVSEKSSSLTKQAISANKPTANTGLSTIAHSYNNCPLDSKSEPMDKVIAIHYNSPVVEDSLLLNKLLEEHNHPCPKLINNTCFEDNVDNANSSESIEENDNHKPPLKTNQSFLQTALVKTCTTSPQPTDVDSDTVCSPKHDSEKHNACISSSGLKETCIPTPFKPELTCTSSALIGAVKSKLPSEANFNDVISPTNINMNDVESLTSANVIHDKSPESKNATVVKSLFSTDMADNDSPATVDIIDVKSPASIDAIDVKLPPSTDAINVKSPTTQTDAMSSESPTRIYMATPNSPLTAGVVEDRSPGKTYTANSESAVRPDGVDFQSSLIIYDSKLSVTTDVNDSKLAVGSEETNAESSVGTDENNLKSPARAGGVDLDVQLPVREDEAKSPVQTCVNNSLSPVRAERIDDQPPVRTDEAKSSVGTYVNDSTSPLRAEGINVQSPVGTEEATSPDQTDVSDSKSSGIPSLPSSKSPPERDVLKLPVLAELEDSSTSSLQIEMNNSSESTTSKDMSKSPLEFNDSKSLSSEDLNNSPRSSPLLRLDTSESPIRTTVLNDSSRTSSRASTIDDTLKSPSSMEGHNTKNSTDTSCSSPLTISGSTGNLQQSLIKTSSSDTLASLTYEDRSKENATNFNSDIGIKLQISSNGTHVIVPKTLLNVAVPSKRKKNRKSRSSPKKAFMAANFDTMAIDENEKPTFTDFKTTENMAREDNTSVNSRSKRKKAAKGAKTLNRKISRKNKTDVESLSGSENNVPEELPLNVEEMSDCIQLAGDEVPVIELHLEDDLEALTIQVVLQESVKTSCPSCVYCNHAKKIAVNGKQLALHLLAEHRFLPVYSKCENTSDMSYVSADDSPSKKLRLSEELSTQVPSTEEMEKLAIENKVLMVQYVNKLKTSLPNLQELFLNTDTYDSSDRTFSHPYDRTYECFHCNFLTVLHKELYVHNRKMHQKIILLCIMCKSNFYSYSELLCHLCPGIYVPESNIKFRCHICSIDTLPSTFRLMVHLRKQHFVCDVCLETTDDQQKLSTHVWKHKLHHVCYRCGISYRNKPDITKHLFWKHGTESVLCKKCLQKKWPHVYHFCIPPNAFVCEECNATFTRAVALKVHKRLHTGDLLHGCDECEEHFISKRLLSKHQDKHREAVEPKYEEQGVTPEIVMLTVKKEEPVQEADEKSTIGRDHISNHLESQLGGYVETPEEDALPIESPAVPIPDRKEKTKKKVDVYDLPPLNLSSDSDESDGGQDAKTQTITNASKTVDVGSLECTKSDNVTTQGEDDSQQPVTVVDGIWDNFQNYKANLERRESQSSENVIPSNPLIVASTETVLNARLVLLDHDYCVVDEDKGGSVTENADQVPSTSVSILHSQEQKVALTEGGGKVDSDHDYCFNKGGNEEPVVKEEECKEKSEPVVPSVDSSSVNVDSSIKKQKSQKKKKRSASSSSSDSSSSSGSSSCSCGENCSCSSSSSSSGSSSDSSDSGLSTSEARGRQIARKERREKVRRKKEEEASARETLATTAIQDVDEFNQAGEPTEPEEKEVPILESDLDTDETETDEDFYDQHPQLLANKLLAEKRNQLLLLAAVAPVNNISPQAEVATPSILEVSTQRKKVKSKKRKKRQHDAEKSSDNKLKLSLSTNYYNFQSSNPDFYKPTESPTFNPMHNFSQSSRLPPAPSIPNTVEPTGMSSAAESGSETDSKRLSKRRRMPKRFYGDSSDEDSSSLNAKWPRKPQSALTSTPIPCPPLTPPSVYKIVNNPPEPTRIPPITLNVLEPEKSDEEDGAETESEQGDVKKSSSESSSESEKEVGIHTDSDAEPPLVVETAPVQQHQQVAKKNENLYCYCQCPYDEVSEMIACDGKDCTIEWFHFECVGIMVPPKGKWFCPDCKKNVSTKNPYFS